MLPSKLQDEISKLLEEERALSAKADDLKKRVRNLLLHRTAIIGRGIYKGRRGVIAGVIFDGDKIAVMCRPINLKDGKSLLWDRPDARSYWPLETLEVEER